MRVTPERKTVWLTQEQMSELFDTVRSSIAYHIGNINKEDELDSSSGNVSRPLMYCNLDVII